MPGFAVVTLLDHAALRQATRMRSTVDAMAIEVERISESQRFMARLQSAHAENEARGVSLRS